MAKTKPKKQTRTPSKKKRAPKVAKRTKPARRKTANRKAVKRAAAPTTTGLRWVDGTTQRLGAITQAWFTDEGILRLEIDCDYTDVSHYSVVFDRQSMTNPLEYSGRWMSNDVNRRSGEVSVTLTRSGSRLFRLSGTWSEDVQNGGWESTSEILIAPRS